MGPGIDGAPDGANPQLSVRIVATLKKAPVGVEIKGTESRPVVASLMMLEDTVLPAWQLNSIPTLDLAMVLPCMVMPDPPRKIPAVELFHILLDLTMIPVAPTNIPPGELVTVLPEMVTDGAVEAMPLRPAVTMLPVTLPGLTPVNS